MRINTFKILVALIFFIVIEKHFKEIQNYVYSILLINVIFLWSYCSSIKMKINIIFLIFLSVHFIIKTEYKLIVEKDVVLDVKITKKINKSKDSFFYKGKIICSEQKYENNGINIYFYNKSLSLNINKIYKLRGILFYDDQDRLAIRSAIIIEYKENIYQKWKKILVKKIDDQFWKISKNENIYAFLNAIILGNKEFLETENKSLYQKSGTMHLFAVSGIHVGFLYIIIKIFFGIFVQKPLILNFITFLILYLYLDIVNYPPSAQRATIMICLFMITKLFHRKTNVLSNIYLTAILVLLFDENYLFDLGFQLSFTVVTAIVVISKNLDYVFNKPIFTYFYRAFLTSYSAFIGSTILVLDAFSIIVPGAILINIIVIPFCFILLIIILSFLGLSTIFQLNLLKEILFELKTFLDSIIGLLNLNQVSYFEINLNNNLHSFYHLVYPITFSLYRFYFKNIWISIFIIFFILPLILMLMI